MAKSALQLYHEHITKRIRKRWKPAKDERRRVHVKFVIGNDGSVIEPRVHESSNDAAYDASALRALAEAGPFEPVPPELTRIHMEIDYLF